MTLLRRRGFLGVMAGLIAAPPLVRAESIMPVSAPKLDGWTLTNLSLGGDGFVRFRDLDSCLVSFREPFQSHLTHVLVREMGVPWRVVDRVFAGAIRASEICPGEIRTADFA
jgi:hypothetical protein